MRNILTVFLPIIILFSCTPTPPPPAPVIPNIPSAADSLAPGWTKVQTPEGWSTDIYFTNNLEGYFMGQTVYKTMDGGNTWNPVWNVDTALSFNIAGTPDGKVFILDDQKVIYTNNGGTSFDTSFTSNFAEYNFDLAFADNNNGFILGSNNLQHTTDGGVSWNVINPITGINFNGTVYGAVFFKDSVTGWVAAGERIYHSNASINSWTQAIINGATPTKFSSIYAPSASVVYAATRTRQVFKSIDGGSTFSFCYNLPSATVNYWADLHFLNNNTGYLSHGNKLYKTIDGGLSWQTENTLASKDFFRIYFTDINHGWAVADSGIVYIFKQ